MRLERRTTRIRQREGNGTGRQRAAPATVYPSRIQYRCSVASLNMVANHLAAHTSPGSNEAPYQLIGIASPKLLGTSKSELVFTLSLDDIHGLLSTLNQ